MGCKGFIEKHKSSSETHIFIITVKFSINLCNNVMFTVQVYVQACTMFAFLTIAYAALKKNTVIMGVLESVQNKENDWKRNSIALF